jgi:hypothetical protein
MFDQVGLADMSQGNLTTFTSDRFGNQNSALALNGGWTYVPPGVYFDSPEFTISLWVYPQTVGDWSRVIDFGNGPDGDNLVLTLTDGITQKPVLMLYAGSGQVLYKSSSQALTLNNWQFLAATLNATFEQIYINGTLVASSNNYFTMRSLKRTSCLIGKSNWLTDGYSSSYLDDLRFFNKSLNQEEIIQLMKQNGTSEF